MSLINQMLRDLEKRRKTESRQLPSGEGPTVVEGHKPLRRIMVITVVGVFAIGLVWLGLEFFPANKLAIKPKITLVPADDKSQRIAIVRGEELFAALEEKSAQQQTSAVTSYSDSNQPVATELKNKQSEVVPLDVAPVKAVKKQSVDARPVAVTPSQRPQSSAVYQPKSRPPGAVTAPVDKVLAVQPGLLVPAEKTASVSGPPIEETEAVAEKSPAAAKVLVPRIKTRVATGNFASTLLNLGVLETVGSARLMFEFEQLPEYDWSFQEGAGQKISIRFQKSGVRAALTIPRLKGPLLKRLSLQPGKESLQLLVESSKKLKVQTLELSADPFHGHRLLVELYVQQPTTGNDSASQVSTAVEVAVAEMPAENIVAATKKVSKKEQSQSREEQAQQAYQSALEQLRRENYHAAEATLTHVLSLQPSLFDARLQLVALLQQLQRGGEAEKLLILGLQLHPDNAALRKNYARQLLADGLLEGAINILLSEPQPEVASDLEYHALLAALHQESGHYKAAVKSYTQLLKYRPREALWWMGLAISYEQSSDYARATKAYQQALSLPGLRPDLQDYIRKRLQVL